MLGSQVPTAVFSACRHHPARAFDFPFAHFNIFEYPGDTRKIHGRKIKQEVEVNLTRKSIDNLEEGSDRFGGNQVVAPLITEPICLQIMNMIT